MNYLVNNQPLNDILLEPFTIFIKLSIVSFKEKGTKISIKNNSIQIEDPHYLQGLCRHLNRTNREHISYLLKPIKRFIIMFPPDNDKIIYIYLRCIKGIEILKDSYVNKASTILNSLDLFICIIKKRLDKDEVEEIHIPEKLYDIWNKDDIHLLYNLIDNCEKNNGDKYYLESIESIIKSKESKMNEIISQII